MHILLIGGTPDHAGGVEAFCERARDAILRDHEWHIQRIVADTAYLTLGKLPRLARGIWALIRYSRVRPDCVWLQYVAFPDLAYLIFARLLGLKVLVTPHLGSNWRSQSNPALRWLSRNLLKLAHRLALISRTQEVEIGLPRSVPRSFIRTFLPAPLLEMGTPAVSEKLDAMRIVHAGRLSEGKGTFLFIEVCKILRDARVPFVANIAGGADRATFARMKSMIEDYSLQDSVNVLGRLEDHEMQKLLRKSDILVHLSRIDSYPLIVLEATACAMFPVCMELAGVRDMVDRYDGSIVSANDPAGESASFLASVSLSEFRTRSQASARKVREDYDWAVCVKAIEEAIFETLGRVQHKDS